MCQALILYELGSIRTVPDHYNIREVYECTANTTPVVFVLPNSKQDTEVSEATKGELKREKRAALEKLAAQEARMEKLLAELEVDLEMSPGHADPTVNKCRVVQGQAGTHGRAGGANLFKRKCTARRNSNPL